MAQTEYTPTWIKEDFFNTANPRTCTILQSYLSEKDGKTEHVVHLGAGKDEVKFSIWGSNKSKVAKQFGDGRTYDTDMLLGKNAKISMTTNVSTGKIERILDVLP